MVSPRLSTGGALGQHWYGITADRLYSFLFLYKNQGMSNFQIEVTAGERFKFGENWSRFLSTINEQSIDRSVLELQRLLGVSDLKGRTFVDVGSGSGLSSLAAFRMGANVQSFDYDPQSVACTQRLQETYCGEMGRWSVQPGSALDKSFLSSLGQFDVVYSWGVLHHTGDMWSALSNMVPLVAFDGLLYIAIYNDQGPWSRRWTTLKRIYNKLPGPLAAAFAAVVMGGRELRLAAGALVRGRPMVYIRSWTQYGGTASRGMSKYYDLIDWIGGYPFEVARPEQIFHFFKKQGFQLENMMTCGGGPGCNQFVLRRVK